MVALMVSLLSMSYILFHRLLLFWCHLRPVVDVEVVTVVVNRVDRFPLAGDVNVGSHAHYIVHIVASLHQDADVMASSRFCIELDAVDKRFQIRLELRAGEPRANVIACTFSV